MRRGYPGRRRRPCLAGLPTPSLYRQGPQLAVELVVSDAHQGLRTRSRIAAVFGGASWQRCRTPLAVMTKPCSLVGPEARPALGGFTMVGTIYQQPSPDEVHAQLGQGMTSQLHDRFPEVASLLGRSGSRRPMAFSRLPTGPLEEAPWCQQPHRSVSTRRSGDAPMWWAPSLTGRRVRRLVWRRPG